MYVGAAAAPPLRSQLAGNDAGDDGDGDDGDGDLEAAAAATAAAWRRGGGCRMYRVEVATPGGSGGGAAVDSLASAWAARQAGPFETGGVNLASLVALGSTAASARRSPPASCGCASAATRCCGTL